MMRRRRINGSDALETINAAAATAIASVDNIRVAQASVQRRRWLSCWSLYWCFGSFKNNNRIRDALLGPETSSHQADEHQSQPLLLPFIVPPSSPASILPSEPQSSPQSPTALLFLNQSPSSIFAIAPYAHETQLVSPPVFSNFATEPSTAPYTPPPESVHLTTPSSPEVPFAHLLEPTQRYNLSQYCEFQSYHQLQPGSPCVSGSGTSSPFPECEYGIGLSFFLDLRNDNKTQILDLDKIVDCQKESNEASERVNPDDENELGHQKNRMSTLGSVREFNIEYVDAGNCDEANIVVDWWANEKVVVEDDGLNKNWSFFPMLAG